MARALRAAGVAPTQLPIEASDGVLAGACQGARAVVAVGGDGSVRSVAMRVQKLRVPLAIVPTGTENLAAREYGFMATADALAAQISRGATRDVDVGVLRLPGPKEHRFLVMASAGFDADVVAALHARRSGPIRHRSYFLPILRTLAGWSAPRVRVIKSGLRSGGDPLVWEGAGMVVVANARQYAMRLDPARDALPDDGELDLVCIPAGSRRELLAWAWKIGSGSSAATGMVRARGAGFQMSFSRPSALQADGDPVPGGAVSAVTLAVEPGALRLVDMRG